MAVSAVNSADTEKSSKEHKGKEKKERPFTKVVIRRLPPAIDVESFLIQISPVPDYDYIYITKGDMSLGENAFSRAYINFVNAADVFMFKEKFDNYVFLDQKGHEYPAVVEFASFQKIPRKRKPRPDPKSGTIESDPYYLEFLESLKEQPNNEEKPEFSYQFSSDKDVVVSTPLLDYVKQRRIDKQRVREERREERRRKDLERKRLREDERKRHEQKLSKTVVKSVNVRSNKLTLDSVKEVNEKLDVKVKSDDEKEDPPSEKTTSPQSSNKDDRKPYTKSKPKYSSRTDRTDYIEKKSVYKNKRDDYREKEFHGRRFDDYKKDIDKQLPRKAKKYSEKREERKNEARKAEQQKLENPGNSSKDDSKNETESHATDNERNEVNNAKSENCSSSQATVDSKDCSEQSTCNKQDVRRDKSAKHHNKEHDPRVQRRIRNKDRPTMAIYQPGMLSRRRTVESDGENNPSKD